jgi:uncharacterized membrane-anchored protein YitT (DUF2179 family)
MLLTLGALGIALAVQGVAVPHRLITGGISGLSLICFYLFPGVSPGKWLFLLNIPIALAGWFWVSRRFILYTMYGMLVTTVLLEVFHQPFPIQDPMLAAIAGGVFLGGGVGLCLRSLGSSGGVDVIAVILHQRFGLRMGQVGFVCNLAVFALGWWFLGDLDRILYSLVMVFVSAQCVDTVVGMFNQRKLVIVISDHHEAITRAILQDIHRGVTLLQGHGGYTGAPKQVILTVVNTVQQKRLEEIIFSLDPNAFVIVENTLNVLGRGFSQRKVY